MLTLAMLFWIGFELSAPTWYWWCWGFTVFFRFIKFGMDMFKGGAKL